MLRYEYGSVGWEDAHNNLGPMTVDEVLQCLEGGKIQLAEAFTLFAT